MPTRVMIQNTSKTISDVMEFGYCIPYQSNSKLVVPNNVQNKYNKTRFVVERFFAWFEEWILQDKNQI